MRLPAICASLAVLIPGAVHAADIYEVPAPVFTPAPAASTWTGIYAGLHGGYGWAGDLSGVVEGNPTIASDDTFFETDVDGPVLGGQIGVNWQADPVVLGIEADASWSGISTDEESAIFDEDVVDYLGSVRVRAGIGLDRLLVYGTGGFGFAGISDTSPKADSGFNGGWVAGAGGEFLLTDRVSLAGQYLHYGLGGDDHGRSATDRFDGSVDALTGRVNVKLGAIP